MKHITMGEINKFQCVGSKCLSSCCIGWGIIVDPNTDRYYQSVEGEFGEKLQRDIDRSQSPAMIKLTGRRRCPFLTDENLCRIYIELGPEHMCDTCRIYPRKEEVVGDMIFHYMTISCPEAGRILFSRKSPLTFRTMNDNVRRETVYEKSADWSFFRLAYEAFEVNAAILKNRSHTIAERQRLFLLFNRALQDALNAGDRPQAEALMEIFSVPANYLPLARNNVSGNLTSKVRFFRELCNFLLHQQQTSPVFQMSVDSVRYLLSEDAHFDEISAYLEKIDGEDFQREQENLLLYLLFSHYLADSLLDKEANRDLFRRAVFILMFFQFYRIFTAIFSVGQNAFLDLSSRTIVVSHLSRYFEHSSDSFYDLFNDTLEKHQFHDLGFLFQLIS